MRNNSLIFFSFIKNLCASEMSYPGLALSILKRDLDKRLPTRNPGMAHPPWVTGSLLFVKIESALHSFFFFFFPQGRGERMHHLEMVRRCSLISVEHSHDLKTPMALHPQGHGPGTEPRSLHGPLGVYLSVLWGDDTFQIWALGGWLESTGGLRFRTAPHGDY